MRFLNLLIFDPRRQSADAVLKRFAERPRLQICDVRQLDLDDAKVVKDVRVFDDLQPAITRRSPAR